MEMKFSWGILLFLSILLASIPRPAETLSITVADSETLSQYMCPPNGTLPPNTNLVINSSLNLSKHFCLIENTTNLSIAASEELLNKGELYVTVTCERDTGFGFFNVSNLTIRSVYFKNCDHVIPETAVRYINGTNQFLYYDNNVRASLIFNHCFNITLYNVLVDDNPDITYGIIGVNLCGDDTDSSISADVPGNISMLIYYTDTTISQQTNYCPRSNSLHMNLSHTILQGKNLNLDHGYNHIPLYELKDEENVNINSLSNNNWDHSLSVYLTQQDFDVDIAININSLPDDHDVKSGNNSINILTCFVNSQTSSRITFQLFKVTLTKCVI